MRCVYVISASGLYIYVPVDTPSLHPGPSKIKVMVKGGAAGDPDSELEGSHHVLEDVH